MDQKNTELTFEGKSFDFWKRVVNTERSIPELTKAIKAFCSLGQNHRDDEAAEAVLKIVMRFDARKYLSIVYVYQSAPNSDSASVTRLLLTAIDQLRLLQPEKVVSEVIKQVQTTHNPHLEFMTATFLAPQQDSIREINGFSRGGGAVSIRNGKLLMKAFYSSPEWISLLESDFASISEELRVTYLSHLLSEWNETSETASLTTLEKQIAHAAGDGKYGRLPRLPACKLLTMSFPSQKITQLVLNLINDDKPATVWQPPNVADPQAGTWQYVGFDYWAMLRDLPHDEKTIATLVAWVKQTTIPAEVTETTSPNSFHIRLYQNSEESFITSPVRLTKSTLAAEILGQLGSHAASAVPVLQEKIADFCGETLSTEGKWTYVSRRDSTRIPSIQIVDSLQKNAAGFVSADPQFNELDALIFAVQKTTGQPVRFETIPTILQSHPNIFSVAELDGKTWPQLLEMAAAPELIPASEIEAIHNQLNVFRNELPHNNEEAAKAADEYNQALKLLMLHTLKLPPNDGDKNEPKLLRTLVHNLEPQPAPQYEELIADCLEATEDPIWQSRIIKEFIAQSAPVSTGNEGHQQLSGVSVPTITAQSLLNTGEIGPRLLTALREVYANADLSSDALLGALLDCVIISQLHQENMELQKTILASKKSTYRLRAASILILEKQLNRSERRTALDLLLSSVLSPSTSAEMINSALPLLAMPGKYWQAKDVRRIVDFLKNDPQKSQPMFVISVPNAPVQSEAGNDVRWNVISKQAYPVRFSQRILLARLLYNLTPELQSTMRQELRTLRDVIPEVPPGFELQLSDSLELLFSKFQTTAIWVDRIEEPDISEDSGITETEVFSTHLTNAVRSID